MQYTVSQISAAVSKLNSVKEKLQRAARVMMLSEQSTDTVACMASMQALLDAAPRLDALSTKKSQVEAAALPLSGKSIAESVMAYLHGNYTAVSIEKSYARNDANGNDHYHVTFRFNAGEKPVTAVISVCKVRGSDGYDVELSQSDSAHWVHTQGEPVERAERDTLRNILEQAAIDFYTDDLEFIYAPQSEERVAAEATLERYVDKIEALPNA